MLFIMSEFSTPDQFRSSCLSERLHITLRLVRESKYGESLVRRPALRCVLFVLHWTVHSWGHWFAWPVWSAFGTQDSLMDQSGRADFPDVFGRETQEEAFNPVADFPNFLTLACASAGVNTALVLESEINEMRQPQYVGTHVTPSSGYAAGASRFTRTNEY